MSIRGPGRCLAALRSMLRKKIVFALRNRKDRDDGVWVATTKEHHASLRRELPNLRSISMFASARRDGRCFPPTLRTSRGVLLACALVRARDPRIGKVPKPRKKATARKARNSGVVIPRSVVTDSGLVVRRLVKSFHILYSGFLHSPIRSPDIYSARCRGLRFRENIYISLQKT